MPSVLVLASLILSVLLLSQPAQAFSLRRRVNESISWLCDSIHFEFVSPSNDAVIRQLNSSYLEIPLCKPGYRLWFWQQPSVEEIEELGRIQWLVRMRIGTLKTEEKKKKQDLELKTKLYCDILQHGLNSRLDDIIVGHLNIVLQNVSICHRNISTSSLKLFNYSDIDELKMLQWLGYMRLYRLKLDDEKKVRQVKFGELNETELSIVSPQLNMVILICFVRPKLVFILWILVQFAVMTILSLLRISIFVLAYFILSFPHVLLLFIRKSFYACWKFLYLSTFALRILLLEYEKKIHLQKRLKFRKQQILSFSHSHYEYTEKLSSFSSLEFTTTEDSFLQEPKFISKIPIFESFKSLRLILNVISKALEKLIQKFNWIAKNRLVMTCFEIRKLAVSKQKMLKLYFQERQLKELPSKALFIVRNNCIIFSEWFFSFREKLQCFEFPFIVYMKNGYIIFEKKRNSADENIDKVTTKKNALGRPVRPRMRLDLKKNNIKTNAENLEEKKCLKSLNRNVQSQEQKNMDVERKPVFKTYVNKVEFLKLIGQGSYGSCFEAHVKNRDGIFAAKRFLKSIYQTNNELRRKVSKIIDFYFFLILF
jgi:hypothetical protein